MRYIKLCSNNNNLELQLNSQVLLTFSLLSARSETRTSWFENLCTGLGIHGVHDSQLCVCYGYIFFLVLLPILTFYLFINGWHHAQVG